MKREVGALQQTRPCLMLIPVNVAISRMADKTPHRYLLLSSTLLVKKTINPENGVKNSVQRSGLSNDLEYSVADAVFCRGHSGAILAPASCMPVTRRTKRKGRMACGGDNPLYAQITTPLQLPGTSFC